MHYDVFNGDADGICALLQLRLEMPLVSTRITGIKRDIALLGRVPADPGVRGHSPQQGNITFDASDARRNQRHFQPQLQQRTDAVSVAIKHVVMHARSLIGTRGLCLIT